MVLVIQSLDENQEPEELNLVISNYQMNNSYILLPGLFFQETLENKFTNSY